MRILLFFCYLWYFHCARILQDCLPSICRTIFYKDSFKEHFLIFLSPVPSAQLFIPCPTLSCRPFPVNGALPCPLFHAKAKDTDSFYLLFIIEDSILLTKYKYGGFYKFHIKKTIINVRQERGKCFFEVLIVVLSAFFVSMVLLLIIVWLS